MLGRWPHCGGSRSAAVGHPRHGAVGSVCGERLAFAPPVPPTPSVPVQRIVGIRGKCRSEVIVSHD